MGNLESHEKKNIFQAWKVMDLCLVDLLLQMSK